MKLDLTEAACLAGILSGPATCVYLMWAMARDEQRSLPEFSVLGLGRFDRRVAACSWCVWQCWLHGRGLYGRWLAETGEALLNSAAGILFVTLSPVAIVFALAATLVRSWTDPAQGIWNWYSQEDE